MLLRCRAARQDDRPHRDKTVAQTADIGGKRQIFEGGGLGIVRAWCATLSEPCAIESNIQCAIWLYFEDSGLGGRTGYGTFPRRIDGSEGAATENRGHARESRF